jgi:hypothetical protein
VVVWPPKQQRVLQLSNTDKNTIRELAAALGQLLDQVDQLKDLCPDDDALRLAIDDAEQALELAR